MHKLISIIKEIPLYKKNEFLDAISSFNRKEMFFFVFIILTAFISMIFLLENINKNFTVEIPAYGGKINEGIIGTPTLVNPVLALSDADKDLTSILYSGLMRKGEDGVLIYDLAESHTVSEDNLTYNFILKDEAKFHDNRKVTADDIIFTIEKIKDPSVKSPRKINWDGISIEKIDNHTVSFTLSQPMNSFLENTTIGILPSHLWKKINLPDFNTSPLNNSKVVGSGPFKIKRVIKDKDGVPKRYELSSFKGFAIEKPYIKNISIISYGNERELLKALNSGLIDQASSISPESINLLTDKNYSIKSATLPRVFGLFFNSSKNNLFEDENIIKAINLAIDRDSIIEEVLYGHGLAINNPIPEMILKKEYVDTKNTEEANSILEKAGWAIREDGFRAKGGTITTTQTKKVGGKNVTQEVKTTTPLINLEISIITKDAPELRKATEIIKTQLGEIGIKVDTNKVYESGQLNQIIGSREYEMLFFGQVINNESDLYSFWHSSQRNDPGLNIAMYNNKKVDNILESIRKIYDGQERLDKYEELYDEFSNSMPAIFIYSPKLLYVTSKDVNNLLIEKIKSPSDRFSLIYKWYTEKEKVWKVFSN